VETTREQSTVNSEWGISVCTKNKKTKWIAYYGPSWVNNVHTAMILP